VAALFFMKITSIKQQVKRVDRYSIYVDDRYTFSLSESALLREGLTSGQELTEAEVADYKRLSADDKLYMRSMHYAAIRPRTEWEMRFYLRRKEAGVAFIDQTVEKLKDFNLINDANYADSFVRDRQLLRPTSKRKLILELKKKHISDTHIQTAIETNELNENDSLQQMITKKMRQSKYHDPDKLMQYLARQGFGYNDIKSAINDIDFSATQ
jgi:regulatory protein